MSDSDTTIPIIQDDQWDAVAEKLNAEQAEQCCIIGAGFGSVSPTSYESIVGEFRSIGIEPDRHIFRGNPPPAFYQNLPISLRHLALRVAGPGTDYLDSITEKLAQLNTLDVCGNGIGEEGAKQIAEKLRQLHTLDIRYNDIGEEGAKQIAEKLRQLHTLGISYNDIGEEGAKQIAEKLRQLHTLGIWGNKIGEEGAKQIAEKLQQLHTLYISHNDIGEEGAKRIAENLSKLHKLYIRGNDIGEEGARQIAEQLGQLRTLDISSNRIGEEGAKQVAGNLGQLYALEIRDNDIGDEGAKQIAENLDQLHALDVSSNDIGDEGAKQIAEHLGQLHTLNVSFNDIGEEGAKQIAEKLQQLHTLWFTRNNIGDEGAKRIAEGLLRVEQLVLCNNGIGELGARAVMSRLECLQAVDLTRNPCGVPDEVLGTRDPAAIRAYFESIDRKGSRLPDSFKLLVLGQGEVGKTHLRHNLVLVNEDKQPDHYEAVLPRTHDIDIHPMFVSLDGRSIQANLWDFGGQQFLHASHRFFLGGQRCLYVIALDAARPPNGDEQSNQLSYWVRMVDQYGRDSTGRKAPLLVVLTRCDREDDGDLAISQSAQANRDAVRSLIEQGIIDEQDFIDQVGWRPTPTPQQNATSQSRWATHGDSMRRLHARILARVNDVPGMDTRLGPEYFAIRDWIAKTFQADDTYAENHDRLELIKRFDQENDAGFRELCETHQIDPLNRETYLDILHNSGLCHWVGRHAEVEYAAGRQNLRSFVFNPHWLKCPTYELIRAQHLSQRGMMSRDAIDGLLPAPAPPVPHESLYKRLPFDKFDRDMVLDMMIVCRVALPAKDDGLMIPDHLEVATGRRGGWDGDDVHQTRFQASFFPEHIFLRFVAQHQHLAESSEDVWRNKLQIPMTSRDGETLQVMLRSDLSPALERQPGIDVWVQGGNERARERILDRLLDEFNRLMTEEGLDELEIATAVHDDAGTGWESLCRSHDQLMGMAVEERYGHLERLSQAVPALDESSDDWIAGPELSLSADGARDNGRLRDRRRECKLPNESLGVDRDDQVWRKGKRSTFYFRPTLAERYRDAITGRQG